MSGTVSQRAKTLKRTVAEIHTQYYPGGKYGGNYKRIIGWDKGIRTFMHPFRQLYCRDILEHTVRTFHKRTEVSNQTVCFLIWYCCTRIPIVKVLNPILPRACTLCVSPLPLQQNLHTLVELRSGGLVCVKEKITIPVHSVCVNFFFTNYFDIRNTMISHASTGFCFNQT